MAKESSRIAHSPASVAWQRFSPCLLIFVAVFVAYFPALNGAFIDGDAAYVTPENLRSLLGLQRIWFEPGATPEYQPILHTVYWLQSRLWGETVLGYHVAQAVFHSLAACLIVALVRRLEVPGGLLAGLLFALHPAMVDAVGWIAQQKYPLAAIFYLAAALLYIGFERERLMWQYDAALAFFIFGLLVHATTAVLPVVLLILFWCERGRLEWRRDFVPLLPWLALSLTATGLSVWFVGRFDARLSFASETAWPDRWVGAGRAAWFYVKSFAWPLDLAFIEPRGSARTAFSGAVALASWSVLLVGLAVIARRWRAPLAAMLAFLVSLTPFLGGLSLDWFGHSAVALRFQYLASIALIIPIAIGAHLTIARLRTGRAVAIAALSAGLVLLGLLTWNHAARYGDAESLYRHTLEKNPLAALAHQQLGLLLAREPGRHVEAIEHYLAARALDPADAKTPALLGRVLMQSPDTLEAALAALEQSLRLRADDAAVRVDYANLLAQRSGGLDAAIREYETAIAQAPDYADAYYHLARALGRVPSRSGESIRAYEQAVRLNPRLFAAYRELGDALASDASRLSDAIAAYQGAVHIRPNESELHLKLARLLRRAPDRIAEAMAAYRRCLELDPENRSARTELQNLLRE